MKVLRLLLGLVISLIVINVTTSCQDEPKQPEEETPKILVDKKDSIFLDNGDYVKATTEFTKEQVEAVLLKTKIWKKTKWLAYETNKITSLTVYPYCYKFNDNNKYQRLYDYATQEQMDKEIARTKEVGYTIEGRKLKFENASLIDYTIVAVDSDRVVLDRLCNPGDWTIGYLPKEFDRKTTMVRCILTPWSPR